MRRSALILLALAACTTPDMIKTSAERNASDFAVDMEIEIRGLSCSASDGTPIDGYVSCTLALSDGTNKPIECNYDRYFAPLGQQTGCKLVVFAPGFAPRRCIRPRRR